MSLAGSQRFNAKTSQRWLAARRSSLTRRAWEDASVWIRWRRRTRRGQVTFSGQFSPLGGLVRRIACAVRATWRWVQRGQFSNLFRVGKRAQSAIGDTIRLSVGGDALLLAHCSNNLGGAYHPGIGPAISRASGGLYIPRPCHWELVYRKALSAPSGRGVLCSN